MSDRSRRPVRYASQLPQQSEALIVNVTGKAALGAVRPPKPQARAGFGTRQRW